MSVSPKRLIKFWQEVKRRKTGRVIVAYAATAFIILQLADILAPALLLPEWTTRLVTLMLIIGFPVAVVLSWIFDITPEGIKKTGSSQISETKGTLNSPSRKILNLSNFIIAALIVILAILVYPKIFERDKFVDIRNPDGKISVAVMPFDNLTDDTTLNWFGKGISSLIINGLGSSKELAVCDDHTMFEAIEGTNKVYSLGISPAIAQEVANNVKSETYISGSFQGREGKYWILANLVNTQNGNIIWTNKVMGNLKSSGYLVLADSLCNEIKNYLELKVLESTADFDFREAYPESAEAYRYFIEGMNLVLNQNYDSGIRSLKKALEIDTAFTFASFYIAYAYCYNSDFLEAVAWTEKTYAYKEKIPPKYQVWIEMWYACYITRNINDIARYCDLLAKSGINTRLLWFDLGATYMDFLSQYGKAAEAFERVMEISKGRDDWKFLDFYYRFGMVLHKMGNHKREREICDICLRILPENSNWMFYLMAICALSNDNNTEADEVLVKYNLKHQDLKTPEDSRELFLGQLYEQANVLDQAEIHFRKACKLNPQRRVLNLELARFLIDNDINTGEGMELINRLLEKEPEEEAALELKGWGLYKQGKYEESVQLLSKMFGIRRGFNTLLYEHLEAAKKALAVRKSN